MFQDLEIFQKCYNNVVGKDGLIEKRKFKVPSELKKVSFIDLENYNKQPFFPIVVDNGLKKIYVIFVYDISLFKSKKKMNEHNKYIENIEDKEKTDLIIIYTNNSKGINYNYTLSKGFMDEYNFNNYHVINYKLVQINITNHVKVPKHEIISEEEKLELINNYYLKSIHDLSCISFQDPQVIYIGGKINDVIKITRVSDTAETSIIYKTVTDTIIIK